MLVIIQKLLQYQGELAASGNGGQTKSGSICGDRSFGGSEVGRQSITHVASSFPRAPSMGRVLLYTDLNQKPMLLSGVQNDLLIGL